MKQFNSLFCRLLIIGFLTAALGATVASAHSDEEVLKLTQTAKYNVVTGNWDVEMEDSSSDIAKAFKKHLPKLDYTLVEEESDGDKINLTFRGPGDYKVVIKLNPRGKETNVRIRAGLTGSEAKSSEMFSYVYKQM